MKRDERQVTLAEIERLAGLDGLEVLEIGCGDGDVTCDLAGRPKKMIAIDPDEASLALARSNVPGVDFRVGSGERLDFPDHSFDLVLFTLSLHHQDASRAMTEAYRVLKEDGRVLVIEPTVDGEVERLFNMVEDETDDILRAAASIKTGPFNLEQSNIYFIEYEFVDRQELYQWIGDCFRTSLSSNITERMDGILGRRINNKPLVVQEKLSIVSLKK